MSSFSEVTQLMKWKWYGKKWNEFNTVSVSGITEFMKWKGCKNNKTNVMVLILQENQGHSMKMMQK